MPIRSALQSASVRLMGRKPTAFFGATSKFELELADLINEVATDICNSHDWRALTKTATLSGDGTKKDFDLPTDYNRMLVKSDVQDAVNWAWGYCNILDVNEWVYRNAHGFEPYPGGWIILEGQMHFTPAPFNGAAATFPYISTNYAQATGGGDLKPAFTADDDEFLLPERLLTLGLVWRWREQKRMNTTGDVENSTKAFNEYAGRDKGSRIIKVGPARIPGDVGIAHPYPLGN